MLELLTDHLRLRPLPEQAASALPADRETASRLLGAQLEDEWPAPPLEGILPRHAALSRDGERFGIWVMIERGSESVVGDIGFRGPPGDDGSVELGYSVIAGRRGRGYATEAARSLVSWAASQNGVRCIVAGCEEGNVASIRTLERAGFQRTGVAGNEIRWCHSENAGG